MLIDADWWLNKVDLVSLVGRTFGVFLVIFDNMTMIVVVVILEITKEGCVFLWVYLLFLLMMIWMVMMTIDDGGGGYLSIILWNPISWERAENCILPAAVNLFLYFYKNWFFLLQKPVFFLQKPVFYNYSFCKLQRNAKTFLQIIKALQKLFQAII